MTMPLSRLFFPFAAVAACFCANGISTGAVGSPRETHRETARASVCRTWPTTGSWAFNAYGEGRWCQRPAKWSWEGDDSDGAIGRVKWTGWGSKVAIGTGIFEWGRMDVYHRARATIRLSRRVGNSCTTSTTYTRMRVTVHSPEWTFGVVSRTLPELFCDVG